ncbi:MAG: FtsX-like permease family protein [Ruminococcaceae bacterium]|nr:FtsX-like permease family protein [Oscillospiraceae bacterium]
MSKGLYFRLAADNMKKNAKTYVPFMITCVITIAMFYIVTSLSKNPGIDSMRGASFIIAFMNIGSGVVAVFSAIFLFYTNSFLLKRRKKEFGLLNILGMEKRHISAVIFLEVLYTAVISLAVGLGGGILLDKLMYLLVANLLDVEVTLGFYVSLEAITVSVILFGVIFFFIYLNSLKQIHFSKPVELLRGGTVGEKEPKTRWLMAFLGLACLAAGYYLSITIKDIASAFVLFFLAVILVIAGTYMLFTAGSVFLLKALRKNKRYYYKTKHFISVSGMIYRMKQNAAGLANICILSTMVLVMLSSTSCLMIGMNEILNESYPYDMTLRVNRPYFGEDQEEKQKAFDEAVNIITEYEKEVSETNVFDIFETVAYFNGGKAAFEGDINTDLTVVYFVAAEDYNKAFGAALELKSDEIAVAPQKADSRIFAYDRMELFGREFDIKERLEYFYAKNNQNDAVAETAVIVISDLEVMRYISEQYCEHMGLEEIGLRTNRVMNVSFTADEKRQYNVLVPEIADKTDRYVAITSRSRGKFEFLDIYGGLFFLGLFLGTLFIMAAVLIIYYKQISEGYDDQKRFEIMQSVGLSKGEVRSSIHSQVLTVFFLPLVAAGVHMLAAFPILKKLLEGLNMNNNLLFIGCTVGCFLIFAVFYIIVYLLTARSYYKIVSKTQT